MHLVRRKWRELRVGDTIILKGDPRWWEIEFMTGGASFVVEHWQDRAHKEVAYRDYEGTVTHSPDCEQAAREFTVQDSTDDGIFREGWGACERHYGISHLGSGDPDPIRELAILILRGDPQAVDFARDALDGGRR